MSDLVKIPITPERAAEAVQRLINSHFGNANGARCRIPADPENDDDLIASRFVVEARERIAQQDAEIAMLRKGCPYEEENETLKGLLRRCYEALTYANPMSLEPQDIERHKAVIAAVDQQLQPKGEQG